MIFRIVNAAAVAVLIAGGVTWTALSAQWLRYPGGGQGVRAWDRMQATPQR